MSQEIKQATVSVPGTEIQGHPVRIFPGATSNSLLETLDGDPEFPVKVNADQHQVATVLDNGVYVVFEPNEDMYPVLKQGSILEIMPNRAPVLGAAFS